MTPARQLRRLAWQEHRPSRLTYRPNGGKPRHFEPKHRAEPVAPPQQTTSLRWPTGHSYTAKIPWQQPAPAPGWWRRLPCEVLRTHRRHQTNSSEHRRGQPPPWAQLPSSWVCQHYGSYYETPEGAATKTTILLAHRQRTATCGTTDTSVATRPTTEKPATEVAGFLIKIRRRPTLPGGCPPSTIGADGLNFRVRNGNGCDSIAMTTGNR